MDISTRDISQFRHLVTPRIAHLSGRELAQAAVRYELIAAGDSSPSKKLVGLVPLALSLGVTVAEAQRLTTYARQTIYSMLNGDVVERIVDRDVERVGRLMSIALVATSHALTLEDVGEAMQIDPRALVAPARLLAGEGLARLAPAPNPSAVTLEPTDLSTEWLRVYASGRQLDRAPGFAVYLKIATGEAMKIDQVAREIVGLDEAAVLPHSTAPSVMDGPELAITVRATDQRSALRTAEAIWGEICTRLQLGDVPMRVADLHLPPNAPAAPSGVLDGFVAGLCTGLDEEAENRVRGERERYVGGGPERVLVGRCLTSASRALRGILGRSDSDRAPTIKDGDSSFEELVLVRGLGGQSKEIERMRKPLCEALELASERLGPFRGGALGSFKSPGGRPRVVREVAPAKEDLLEMGRLAGLALAAGQPGEDEAVRLVREVVDPL